MLFLAWLPDLLSGKRLDLLRAVLGLIIVASSLQVGRTPEAIRRRSGSSSSVFFGALSAYRGIHVAEIGDVEAAASESAIEDRLDAPQSRASRLCPPLSNPGTIRYTS
jgi:hypothetical protein